MSLVISVRSIQIGQEDMQERECICTAGLYDEVSWVLFLNTGKHGRRCDGQMTRAKDTTIASKVGCGSMSVKNLNRYN